MHTYSIKEMVRNLNFEEVLRGLEFVGSSLDLGVFSGDNQWLENKLENTCNG